MKTKRRRDIWTVLGLVLLLLFVVFFIYPCIRLLWEAFYTEKTGFTMKAFTKFFSKKYYYSTILNSFKVSAAVMLISLLLGIPFSYFFSFYKLKGRKVLFVLALLCTMSAPFIGAYSWIMLLGRSGVITKLLESVGIKIGSIYGFGGILLVQSLKLFPLVMIYMNGAFQDIDNSLLEASANLGCTGLKRFFKVIMGLTMPTILAAALIVFMRAFADFGTPALIGEGYKTFPVLIYDSFLSEVGADYNFASAVSVLAIILTAAVFLVQKFATSRFKFTINSLHPIQKKEAKGVKGFFMHAYCYLLIAVALLPQFYIVFDSFRDYKGQVAQDTYSLSNYQNAIRKLLGRSIKNTLVISILALAVIVIIAVIIAYLVVRRPSALSHSVDTISMLPYIMPGAVIGIALIIAFNTKYFSLTGTLAIMVIALAIRRMPYTSRSATATMMQIPISTEEAAISLGASKIKTFIKITVPQMTSGIVSGAILSFVSIITEMSSGIFLYNNSTITLTLSTYNAITLGSYGTASAFATVTTLLTIACLVLYLVCTRGSEKMSV
ncbi:MAG: iron ABC transporter permease [Eubacteriales bacterium]|nr:iron ABC transporter permease [Eubacteriales bacterium]